MKLCILGDASYTHAKNWVDYFTARGIETYLISLQKSIGTSGTEYILPSKKLPGFIKYPLASGKVASLIKSIKPDVINAHFVPNYGFISAIIGAKPLVVSCFGSDILEPPRKGAFRKARIKFTLNKADIITTDGEILRKAVHSFGIPKDRIVNVPIGIDTKTFIPREKSYPPKIVYLRRLEHVCNPTLFIKALPKVLSSCNVKPVVLSMGSLKNEVVNLAKKLGIESKIEFVPFLPAKELAKLLGESTLYVSTSISDSTSVTLMEAMACGTFPVVTDIEGNREWITNDVNGYLTPLDDHQQLADKIIQALTNPKIVKKAISRNIELIREHGDRLKNMYIVEKALIKLAEKHKSLKFK